MKQVLSITLLAVVLTFPACEWGVDKSPAAALKINGTVKNISRNRGIDKIKVIVTGCRLLSSQYIGCEKLDSVQTDVNGWYKLELTGFKHLLHYFVEIDLGEQGQYLPKKQSGVVTLGQDNIVHFGVQEVQLLPMRVVIADNKVGDIAGTTLTSFKLFKSTRDTLVPAMIYYKTAPQVNFGVQGKFYSTQAKYLADSTMLELNIPDPATW